MRWEASLPSDAESTSVEGAAGDDDEKPPRGGGQEVAALEVRHAETPQETLDRLAVELAELRASRKRLVLAADADRRGFEQELHEGLQQDVVALAVNLQLVSRLADDDPAAAQTLLDEIRRDVQQAIDASARLAARIYPSLLGSGLALALRAAAATAGIVLNVEGVADREEVGAASAAAALSCLEALERCAPGARATVVVSEGHLTFEIIDEGGGSADGLAGLVDRVEALDGLLRVDKPVGGGTRLAGSIPWAP